jgi:hypothetical protein
MGTNLVAEPQVKGSGDVNACTCVQVGCEDTVTAQ